MNSLESKFDVAIVGGGIIGLAHAFASLQKGYSVLLVEKEEFAVGASIRNFGLIWPIGQPAGPLYDRTMKSRKIWLELSKKAGFWALENGSLHLAYQKDEFAVIEEYHTKFGNQTKLLKAEELLAFYPHLNPEGLIGGMFSRTELNVNPKRAVHAISGWLSKQDNCTVQHGEKAMSVESGVLHTTKGSYQADKILVCSGSDFQSLFPEIFAKSPMTKSKLQMMRTRSQGESFRLGPTLCGGLTLRHYASFAQCDSLKTFQERVANEIPEFDEWGIHVMVSQNEFNEMIIGDSHEYGLTFDPFDKTEINGLILNYLKSFVSISNLEFLETWHGIYAKNQEGTEFVAEPENGVKIITGFGGAGMTFSFGYALEEVESW